VIAENEEVIGAAIRIGAGENLSSADASGIVLGEGLASNLGVVPGDAVVLLSSTASGGMNAAEAQVRGLFYTYNKARDDSALRVPLAMAQELLRISGAHRWVVLLNETEQTDAVLQRFRQRFPEATSQLQFIPWYELADVYNKTAALFSRQMNFVKLIIGLIFVLSISNTLTMSVMERTGEIGTLMALGTRRWQIVQLFFTEGALLGILGGLAGLLIGVTLAFVISAIGIPMPPPPGMEHGYTGRILVNIPLATNAFLIAFTTATVASIYPAWKAARLEVVDALRHNK
jgi:putative ABC transport system permease protein